ncbi:PIG-L family deacetylase [bacterium]|nr:PIG-L family deacetylase [bacterium]
MSEDKRVLALFAHPDDAEFMCAGTLALLRERGWQVSMATITAGDCGSKEHSSEEISRIRQGEAASAAKLLGAPYQCFGSFDFFIQYDRVTLLKAIKLVRQVMPTIVFAPSPSDYLIDHEITSLIAQTACFTCGLENIHTDGVSAFKKIPHLYYADPIEGKDKFGNTVKPTILVDITSSMDTKEKMLCCHQSQRVWLQSHHGMDEYTEFMKRLARDRGQRINCIFAEGFRQHLGHGYPQDNILKVELVNLVH